MVLLRVYMYKIATVPFMMGMALLTVSGSAWAADVTWTNSSGDGLWRTAANWSPFPPDITYGDKAKINQLPGPLIDSGTAAGAGMIALSDGTPGGLRMTGGTLNVAKGTQPGSPLDSWFIIGYGATDNGTFTMDGGTVTTVDRVYVGFMGTGTIIINGGSMNIGGLFGIGYCDNGYTTTGRGYVYVNGGTITVASFQMGYPAGCVGNLDVSGGTFNVNGDVRAAVSNHIDNGWITAYGGLGDVVVTFDMVTGKTTLTGTVDPTKARKPYPRNNAINLPSSAVLNWVPGVSSVTHDIYIGTDPNLVVAATQSSTDIYKGSHPRDANSYSESFQLNQTYYWRVDEVNGVSTIHGDLWKFSIESRAANTPTPPDTYANVAVTPTLKWAAGPDGVSHDVYCGTDASAVANASRLVGDIDGNGRVDCNDVLILSDYWLTNLAGSSYGGVNGDAIVDFKDFALLGNNWLKQASLVYKGNQTTTAFNAGNLTQNTIYYWRIDDINGPIIRKGNVWCFKTTGDTYSMVGKIMCGYQGWFNAPTDGAGRGWVHWGRGGFTPQIVAPMNVPNVTVDFWPDMSEYDADEKYPATAFGANQYIYSSYNRKTVMRHFKWMQDYGIDGVYMQRFVTEIYNDPGYNHFTTVLTNARDAANLYGRKYAIMYDLSSMGAVGVLQVEADWKKLVDNLRITRNLDDNAYICHNGKPVVALWGIGWDQNITDRNYTWADCLTLVNFLKDDPNYGGNTVMIGVKSDWLESYNTDPTMAAIVAKADIISPWTVSAYKNTSEVSNYAANVWGPDITWCRANNKDYLPVVWPGYSRRNLDSVNNNAVKSGLNKRPRYGGQFLWDQYYYTKTSDTNMIYVAMFDEVDEGTAIYKITNSPPTWTYPGGTAMFWTYEGLPSDEYLWLCGQGARMLRGEIPLTSTRPAR